MAKISLDMKLRLSFSSLFLLCLSLMPSATYGNNAGSPQILASWVQYITDGVEVRVVTTGTCPDVVLGGKPRRLKKRFGTVIGVRARNR